MPLVCDVERRSLRVDAYDFMDILKTVRLFNCMALKVKVMFEEYRFVCLARAFSQPKIVKKSGVFKGLIGHPVSTGLPVVYNGT